MPVYKIRNNRTGETLTLVRDSPPQPDEIAAEFAKQSALKVDAPGLNRAPDAPPDPSEMGSVGQPIGLDFAANHADTALDLLPAVGATAGGIAGAAGSMGLATPIAAAGGAATGEGLRQMGRSILRPDDPQPSAGEIATGMLKEGVKGGVIDAATLGLGYGAGAAGRALQRSAFTNAPTAILERFPGLADFVMKQGTNITNKGAATLGTRGAEAAGEAGRLGSLAQARGTPNMVVSMGKATQQGMVPEAATMAASKEAAGQAGRFADAKEAVEALAAQGGPSLGASVLPAVLGAGGGFAAGGIPGGVAGIMATIAAQRAAGSPAARYGLGKGMAVAAPYAAHGMDAATQMFARYVAMRQAMQAQIDEQAAAQDAQPKGGITIAGLGK